MVWVKGQRCGIDNCASVFYQVLNGHKVCRNGHVQEGLETIGDDDDFAAAGHKIRRPKIQPTPKSVEISESLTGKDARIHMLKLLQKVLISQAEWLVENTDLPPNFIQVVKSVWAHYLNKSKITTSILDFDISLLHLVVLCYLSTRWMNSHYTLFEFNMFLSNTTFPYLNARKCIPPNELNKLSKSLANNVFTPIGEPRALQLYILAKHVKSVLNHIKFPRHPSPLVVFKMCKYLILPPTLYVYTLRILNIVEPDFHNDESTLAYDEIPEICAVVVCLKLIHGFDDIKRKLPKRLHLANFDWDVWKDLMIKLWLELPGFMKVDERLSFYWDDEKINTFADWFAMNFIDDSQGMSQRLGDMFPLSSDEVPVSFLPSDQTLSELAVFINSSMPDDYYTDYDSYDDEGSVLAGEKYRSYLGVQTEKYGKPLPEILEVLHSVVANFIGASPQKVATFVHTFEIFVRRYSSKA